MNDEPHNTAPEIWNLGFEEGQVYCVDEATIHYAFDRIEEHFRR